MRTNADIGKEAARFAACDTVAIFKREGVTARKIAKEISLLAFTDIADFVQVDDCGSAKPIALDEIKKDKTRAIKKIKEKRRILSAPGKSNDDTILEDTFEFELYDKLDALRLGAECLGLKKPPQIQANINAQVALDEDLKEFVDLIIAGAGRAAKKAKKK